MPVSFVVSTTSAEVVPPAFATVSRSAWFGWLGSRVHMLPGLRMPTMYVGIAAFASPFAATSTTSATLPAPHAFGCPSVTSTTMTV